MGFGMKLLLDTHALLWWFDGSSHLSRRALRAIESQSNSVVVSAVSAWEIAIKSAGAKLDAGPLLAGFRTEIEQEGFSELPISLEHAVRAGLLPGPHHDPFDRMLIAQAQLENLAIVSRDDSFDRYSVRRIW
jgi:PIN domain nuclease of toxin-antitoxin system